MKQWMKAMALLLCLLFVSVALTACGEKETPPVEPDPNQIENNEVDPQENDELGMPQRVEIDLVGDLSNGNSEGRALESSYEVSAATVDGAILSAAEGLSEWTGLDFALNSVTVVDNAAIVDWSVNSTLVAGLDDREQKEEFFFFDVVSLNWFMMDSMAATIKANFPIDTVYYTMDGGSELAFSSPEDMASQGLPVLPVDQPYEGSAFFVGHAGLQGE